MVKDTLKKVLLLMMVFGAFASAATTGGAGALFQPAWDVLSAILGDTYLGYIVAAFMLIKAIAVYMTEGGNWTKILMYILAAGFTASIVTLAQSLAGATF